MKHFWTWGGIYFGYSNENNLFTHNGKCIGSIQDGYVFDTRGRYLGEVIDNNRLISDRSKSNLMGQPCTNAAGAPYLPYMNYAGNAMYAGYKDFPSPNNF